MLCNVNMASSTKAQSYPLLMTDGIRGLYGSNFINTSFFYHIGLSFGYYVRCISSDKMNCFIFLAQDGRLSCSVLEKALLQGISSQGISVIFLGVQSTSCLSYVVRESDKRSYGFMITASHNQYHDNGIKFFNNLGCKDSLLKILSRSQGRSPVSFYRRGSIYSSYNYQKKYYDSLISLLQIRKKHNVRVVFDIANGSLSSSCKYFFEKQKAFNAFIYNRSPNGSNINYLCGSENPSFLVSKVLKTNSDCGFAFDGDGDRCIMCDRKGRIYDGDDILSVLFMFFYKQGLNIRGVVGTEISNSALDLFVRKHGASFYRSQVGDVNIYKMMKKHRYLLGGEPSGHIIVDPHTSPDGLLSAILLLNAIDYFDLLTSSLTFLQKMPCLKGNVRHAINDPKKIEYLKGVFNKYQLKQTKKGVRCIIRFSGTEKLVRILIETPYQGQEALFRKVYDFVYQAVDL